MLTKTRSGSKSTVIPTIVLLLLGISFVYVMTDYDKLFEKLFNSTVQEPPSAPVQNPVKPTKTDDKRKIQLNASWSRVIGVKVTWSLPGEVESRKMAYGPWSIYRDLPPGSRVRVTVVKELPEGIARCRIRQDGVDVSTAATPENIPGTIVCSWVVT